MNDLKTFFEIYGSVYTILYDKYMYKTTAREIFNIPDNENPLNAGDEWIITHQEEVEKLIEYRQDYFTSDREIIALYITLRITKDIR